MRTLLKVYRSGLFNRKAADAALVARLLNCINQANGLTVREMSQKTRAYTQEIEAALVYMQRAGWVHASQQKARNGRTIALWHVSVKGLSLLRKYRDNTPNEVQMPQSLRFAVLKRDGYSCQICGRDAADGVKLEVDHRVPRAKGGTDDSWNLWTLCFDCNRGKSATDL